MRSLICLCIGIVLSACYLPDVDISGKGCPCTTGYECSDGLCVPRGQQVDASPDAEPDASPDAEPDTSPDADGEPCQPLLEVEGFRAVWSTPNAIRWAWDARLEDEEHFFEYRLVLAESIEDVESRSGTSRVFDQRGNPELGRFVLPRLSGSDDLVLGTTTDDLRHTTPYYGQLIVIDRGLCEFRAPVVPMSTTLELTDEIVIFRDDQPPGSPRPSGTFLPQPDSEGEGNHLEHIPDTDEECNEQVPRPNVCPNNLRWLGLGIELSEISTEGLFETAIFELLVWYDGVNPSYWSHLWLSFYPERQNHSFQVFTIRSTGGYDVVQVPLGVLQFDGIPLSFEYFAAHDVLDDFCVYGRWERFTDEAGTTPSRVRVDEVRIRY